MGIHLTGPQTSSEHLPDPTAGAGRDDAVMVGEAGQGTAPCGQGTTQRNTVL